MKDAVIFDRGYASYELFALFLYKYKSNFLIRVKTNSFYKKELKVLLDKSNNIYDIVVTLKAKTKDLKKICSDNNLPLEIKVRFIKVILDNGDIEILATSILDNNILKTKDFKELYFKRWKIETFYDILKNRLNIENFTSKSALGVKQDFFATIFLCNIEALITYDINKELDNNKDKRDSKDTKNSKNKKRKHTQQVNKSVSFNTIKQLAFELFLSTTR